MPDEMATELTRLFAVTREPLADRDFVAAILAKIDRTRRLRTVRRMLAIAVFLVIAGCNMRIILGTGEFLVRVVGEFSATYTELLISPLGWAMSMFFGVWVVLRARKSRR